MFGSLFPPPQPYTVLPPLKIRAGTSPLPIVFPQLNIQQPQIPRTLMIASKPTYLSPDPNHNLPLHTKISVLPVPAPSSPGQSFHHLPLLLYTHKGGLLTTRLTSGIFEDYSLPPPKNYPSCIISISSSDSPTSCVVWKKNSEVLTLHK